MLLVERQWAEYRMVIGHGSETLVAQKNERCMETDNIPEGSEDMVKRPNSVLCFSRRELVQLLFIETFCPIEGADGIHDKETYLVVWQPGRVVGTEVLDGDSQL